MVNDEQHDPGAAGRYRGVPTPGTSWGGEYDGEATAFVQLPPGGPDGPDAGDPLAAPGHGYRPPEIGTAAGPFPPGGPRHAGDGHADPAHPDPGHAGPAHAGPPPLVGATTDPAATGGWALPFTPEPETDRTPPAAGDAAAMGQGAAAALAGVHQGRGRRRPLGEGPAAEHGGAVDGGTASGALPAQPGPDVRHHPPHAPEPDEPPAAALPTPPVPVPADGQAPRDPEVSDHPTVSYVLHVNGVDRPVTGAWIGESLLHVLRERLGLAGAKDGCSQGECGACSVQVDGRLVVACLVPAATAAGAEIRTVEGLGTNGEPSDVQRALAACQVQCGFCLPGMAMTVHDLLEGNHDPGERETRQALCGNLCRCTGYRGVLDAVRQVARERADRASAPEPGGEDGTGAGAAGRIPHQSGPHHSGPHQPGPHHSGPHQSGPHGAGPGMGGEA